MAQRNDRYVLWNNGFIPFDCCWRDSVKAVQFFCHSLPISYLVDERHYWRTFFSKLQHNDNCVCVLWHICPPHPPFIWSLGTSKQIWSKWCLSCSVYNQTASMVEFCTETSPLSDYPCVFYRVIVQSYCSLWPPYVIGGPLYFCPVVSFYLLSIFFFSSPYLSGHRLDVYHTSTHGVALVRI